MRRENSRYTYVVFALVCLIVFNIGAFLISQVGLMGNRDLSLEPDIRPVFRENITRERGNFFINIFSKSSAAISVYKSQSPGIKGESILNIIKSQLPFSLFNKDRQGDGEEYNNENMEDSIVTEDFIVIDRVKEYEDLIVITDTEGNLILENLPKPINVESLKVDKDKPYVLIYHTHGTEAYSNQETNLHHTTDRNYNVVTIGENVTKVLEAKGHNVEHITTYHDIPSYNQSYSRSLNTITEKIQENNNFKILLDIHRDGIDLDNTSVRSNLNKYIDKFTTKIDGKDVATFYFVIGPDSPNKDAVLSFAKYFKAIADIVYPDLCTGILIKPRGKYNQFMSDYSMLVEIGANINTMEEALESARLFGEIMDLVLQNILE